MKKGLLLLIILTVLGCNEDPELKEENKVAEFKVQQGQFGVDGLLLFIRTVLDPSFLGGSFDLVRRTGGDVPTSEINNLRKGRYENLYSVFINNADDGKGDRYFPITIVIE